MAEDDIVRDLSVAFTIAYSVAFGMSFLIATFVNFLISVRAPGDICQLTVTL